MTTSGILLRTACREKREPLGAQAQPRAHLVGVLGDLSDPELAV